MVRTPPIAALRATPRCCVFGFSLGICMADMAAWVDLVASKAMAYSWCVLGMHGWPLLSSVSAILYRWLSTVADNATDLCAQVFVG